MDELSIKVDVAGRIYPLTIAREDEEFVRKMARKINDDMKFLQDNYAVKDKQDLLAMIALQLATDTTKKEAKQEVPEDLQKDLESLDKMLDSYL